MSETNDLEFGTVTLPGSNFNVEMGTCLKTEAAFRYFAENEAIRGWKWLVLVEDDTALSVAKLLQLIQVGEAGSAVEGRKR